MILKKEKVSVNFKYRKARKYAKSATNTFIMILAIIQKGGKVSDNFNENPKYVIEIQKGKNILSIYNNI